MSARKRSAVHRIAAALAEEAVEMIPSLEEALDDIFGPRFDVPSAQDGLVVAGNWHSETEEECDLRMGLVEAILTETTGDEATLEKPGSSTGGDPSPGLRVGHVRGFTLDDPDGFAGLNPADCVDAADMINDEFMAAMMAMIAEGTLEGSVGVFVIVHYAGRSRAARRRAVQGAVEAVCAWMVDIDAVGIVVSPPSELVSRVALKAGVDPDTARKAIEDAWRDEVDGLDVPEGVFLHLLSVPDMSFQESAVALGRFIGGEGAATILAAPTTGEGEEVYWSAARMPVPSELLVELRKQSEGRSLTNIERIGMAVALANAHVVAIGAVLPEDRPEATGPGCDRTLNSTASLIAISLHMRSMAFEQALADAELGAMLMRLREAGRVAEVFTIAATAPLYPGIGDVPRFLPEFRERIEDLIMAAP